VKKFGQEIVVDYFTRVYSEKYFDHGGGQPRSRTDREDGGREIL